MSDTLKRMDYIYADILSPDQLMEDDLIGIYTDGEQEIVTVRGIISLPSGYEIIAINEYGEMNEYFLSDDEKVKLYVLE